MGHSLRLETNSQRILEHAVDLFSMYPGDSHASPKPLEPGKRYEVAVSLTEAAHVFAAGNRLRIAISNCYWPMFCCFFPLYEVEHGITTINYDPEEKGKKVPVTEWLKHMGKTKHMLKPDCKPELDRFQVEVDRRWVRLKEFHKNPLL